MGGKICRVGETVVGVEEGRREGRGERKSERRREKLGIRRREGTAAAWEIWWKMGWVRVKGRLGSSV